MRQDLTQHINDMRHVVALAQTNDAWPEDEEKPFRTRD